MSALTTQANASLKVIDSGIAPYSPLFSEETNKPVEANMTLVDILAVLKRRKWIILLTLLSSLAIAVIYSLSLAPSYRSNAIIQIEREGAEIVDFGKTSRVSGNFDVNKDPFFRTRYEMLKSRSLATKVIDELQLQSALVPKKKQSLFSVTGLMNKLGLSNANSKSESELPVDYSSLFTKKLLVQPIAGTHLVEVFFEAPSAKGAQEVVTSLVDNFIKNQIETKSETGEYAKEFLSKQLAESRIRLRESEEAFVKYANDKGILEVDDKQTRHVKKLENLDAALVKAEINRIEAESLYQQMKRAGSVSTVLSNPVVASLKARLVQLEGDYQEMLKTFKPNYPDMIRLKQQINNAQHKLNREMGTIQKSMEADYLAAKRQEDKIKSELTQFNREMHDLQNSSIDYNTLKREVETNRKLHNNLLQRLEEVNVASAVTASSISIVEPALLPLERYGPKRKLNVLIGLFSGLLLGLGLAFLREALDHSINSSDELERYSRLPVLGTIPRVTKSSIKSQLSMIASKLPQSSAAEAYRVSSTNIRFMVDSQDQHVLLVTSSRPGEGKSTTASNLAISYAQMGMKVLLVDADIRNSSLHRNMNLSNDQGLTHYLKGEVDLVGITQTVKNISGLYAITAGAYNPDPISLLSHERMSYLTSQGATIFDYVIIDAPPVEGFADTLILSSLASSTIVVAKENALNTHRVKNVLKQLGRVKNNVLGFLIVDARKTNANSKYYSRYHSKEAKKALLENKKSYYA